MWSSLTIFSADDFACQKLGSHKLFYTIRNMENPNNIQIPLIFKSFLLIYKEEKVWVWLNFF